jgi:hypothetical protein
LRGPDDAPPLLGGQRPGGILQCLAPLHLDEGEPPALERHQVDLADRGLVAPRHDCVALEAKQERRDRLGEQAAAIGFDPSLAHFSRA